MKKELRKCFSIGFVFICIFGTLLRFLYNLTSDNRIVGLLCPVNNSVWEHMKRFFFPMLLFTVIMSYFNILQTYYPALVPALLSGLLLGTWMIPVIFFSYSGILGFRIPIFDVLIIYFSTLQGLRIAYGQVKNSGLQKYEIPLKICTMLMLLLFMLFSYHPLQLGIFR